MALVQGTGTSGPSRRKKDEEEKRPRLTPPLEAQVRNIALGYRDANGSLPGSGKMVDLLGTALASVNDRLTWREFFANVAVRSMWSNAEGFKKLTAEDVLYDGDVETEQPLIDKVIFKYGPGVVLGTHPYVERKLAERESENFTLPRPKTAAEIAVLSDYQKDAALKLWQERGLAGEVTVPQDKDVVLEEAADRWIYGGNIADAVITQDPKAILAVQETGLIDPDLTPRQALYALHSNTNDLKDYIYQRSFEARHPSLNEYEFLEWYGKKYGEDWLPTEYAPILEAKQGAQRWDQLIDPIKYALMVDNPEAEALAKQMGAVPGFDEMDAATISIIDSLGGGTGVATKSGKGGAIKFRNQQEDEIALGALQLLNKPIEMGNRAQVFVGWAKADILKRAVGREWWDANAPLITQFAESWKQSEGKSVAAEFLRMADIDPTNHPDFVWGAQLANDTALGLGVDGATIKVLGAALSSSVGSAAKAGMGARPTHELIAESKNAFVIRQMEGLSLTPEEATHLAANVGTPDAAVTWFNERGKLFAIDQNFDPTLPMLKTTQRYNRLMDNSIPSANRALDLPEHASPIDLVHTADQRTFDYLIHAGYDTRTALQKADDVTRTMGESAEARRATFFKWRDLDDELSTHLASQPAPADIAKKLQVEKPTKLDAYHYLNQKIRGKRDLDNPASGYSPFEEEIASMPGGQQLVEDARTIEGSAIIDDVRRAQLERDLADANGELAVWRDALIDARVKLREGVKPKDPAALAAIQQERQALLDDFAGLAADDLAPVAQDAAILRRLKELGIRPDNAYWSKGLTPTENLAAFRGTVKKGGMAMDDVAGSIGEEFPGTGITSADDLWDWMQRTRGTGSKKRMVGDVDPDEVMRMLEDLDKREDAALGATETPDLEPLRVRERLALQKLAATGHRRKQLIADNQTLSLENAARSAPATEAQVAKSYAPKFDEATLSLLNADPAFRKWALTSNRFKLNTISRFFRYFVLWKFGTVMRIMSDEGTRGIVSGMVPGVTVPERVPLVGGKRVGKKYLTPAIEEIIAQNPEFRVQMKNLLDKATSRHSWTVAVPGSREFAPGYKAFLRNHNAGPQGQRPYQDWARAWKARMYVLTQDGTIPETAAMLDDAAQFADDHLRYLCRTDPTYVGSETTQGWLRFSHITPSDELAKLGAKDTLDDWLKKAIGARGRRMVGHMTTRRHFLEGPTSVKRGEASDLAVQQAAGDIMVPNRGAAYVGDTKLRQWGRNIRDLPYEILDYLSTDMKQQYFAYFYKKHHAEMNRLYPDADPDLVERVIQQKALAEASDLTYTSIHTTREGRLGHAFLFLPAYVQSAKWWVPWIAKHPIASAQVYQGMSDIAPREVPDWVPILGGKSVVDFTNISIMPHDWREALPPITPTVTEPTNWAVALSVPGSERMYDALTYGRGFDPGGPLNRPVDSFLFLVSNGLWNPGDTVQDIRNAKGTPEWFRPQLIGTEKIADKRRRVAQAFIQQQAMMGQDIDPKKAERDVIALEGARGITNWFSTTGQRVALPTVTVFENNGAGTKGRGGVTRTREIDLQRLATAQGAYLNAEEVDKAAILKAYPEYAPIAQAWQLRGNDQLDYLSRHQWVIPFVVARSEKDYENPALAGREFADMTRPLTADEYAENIKERYQQVWSYELGVKYNDLLAKVEKKAERERKKLTPLQREHYDDWTKPKLIEAATKAFEKQNRDQIVKACGENALIGDDHPWTEKVKIADYNLDSESYQTMKGLEERGDDYSLRLLRHSPLYPAYLERKEQEAVDKKNAYLKAATVNYKSTLKPEDFAAMGIPIPKNYEKGVMDFLGVIDRYQKKLDKLYDAGKFGTDEYKALYFEYKSAVDKGRKNPTIRKIVDRNPVDWLVSGPNALNEPHWKPVAIGPKTHGSATMLKTWQKVKNEFLEEGMTPSRVVEVRKKYGGVLGENFDEAVRAWCWAYVKHIADAGRDALASSDNPYGWYKGWTIDSKYGKTMKKWVGQQLQPILNGSISPEFADEWEKANKAAGGNIISDFLDLSH